VEGENTIAVRLHQASAQNGDASFDLGLEGLGGIGDSTPPSAPTASATGGSGAVSLAWSASADTNLIGYEVLRDGQTIAFVDASRTEYVEGGLGFSETHGYQVKAVDAEGNTAVSDSVDATTTPNTALLSFGSPWRWRYDETEPPVEWNLEGFDDSAWNLGASELGYGDADESTVMTTDPTPRPLIAQFRTTVDITDPTAFSQMLVEAVRDDGIVVYVNGVEVGRDNIAPGPVTSTTPAAQALTNRTDEVTPVSMSVPSSAFHPGSNTIAVSVHNSDRWSGDLSFNLRLTGVL
jgi:hypothetical protein